MMYLTPIIRFNLIRILSRQGSPMAKRQLSNPTTSLLSREKYVKSTPLRARVNRGAGMPIDSLWVLHVYPVAGEPIAIRNTHQFRSPRPTLALLSSTGARRRQGPLWGAMLKLASQL